MNNANVSMTLGTYEDWQTLNISNVTPQIVISGINSNTSTTTLTSSNTLPLTNKKTNVNELNNTCSNIDSVITIKDIKIIVPNKVVEITYKDNTKEKVVCDNEDNFSLDAAIAICALKKLMGNSKCNHYLKSGYKIIDDKEKLLLKEQEEKEIIARKKEKAKLKKEKRRLKKREEQINIIAEAIKRSEPITIK